MSCRPWPLALLAPLAACAALAGLLPRDHAGAAPAPLQQRPRIELVVCLDTTGSMSMIERAKGKIWLIFNQALRGRPTPELRVGMVNFKDKGDVWVTKVFEMTDDLDSIHADFSTFKPDGGGDTPESVNQALDDSVNKIRWSTDRKVLRVVFLVGDAPPHMDYLDDVKYPVTCNKALQRGILINAIQCGTDAECTKYWKDIAAKANGVFAQIPGDGGMQDYNHAQDRRLAELNAELARTTLVWGNALKRDADNRKLGHVRTLSGSVAADRVSTLAKVGITATYDLLDNLRAGKVSLADIKTDELPAELQKLSDKERREFLDKLSKRRGELLREVLELDRQRGADQAKAAPKDGFDTRVLEILRAQAKKHRIRY
jgi:Mg-chelatase subunit ChlD